MANSVLTPNEAGAGKAEPRAGKYLVFHLGAEEFGIQVQKVREIMGVQDITQVPQTPPHVKGVINLRGKVIPRSTFSTVHLLVYRIHRTTDPFRPSSSLPSCR